MLYGIKSASLKDPTDLWDSPITFNICWEVSVGWPYSSMPLTKVSDMAKFDVRDSISFLQIG